MKWLLMITLLNGEVRFFGYFESRGACMNAHVLLFGERKCALMVPRIDVDQSVLTGDSDAKAR